MALWAGPSPHGRGKSAPSGTGPTGTSALRAAEHALGLGDSETAYRQATAAFRQDPSPEALFLLGRVALAQNRRLEAQDLMRRYLADPGLDLAADAPEPRTAAELVAQPALESAQLNILGDREALVFVDGRLVGRLPLSRPLLLSPAPHKLELVRGERRVEDSVRVPLGRLAELRCDLSSRTSLLSILPSIVLIPQTVDASDGQATLLRMLEDAMAKARVAPLRAEQAFALAGEPTPGACPDTRACTIALAQSSEADYLLQLQAVKRDTGWHMGIELLDGQVGEAAAQGERRCERCTAEAAGAVLVELFAAAYDQARKRPRSRLQLRVDPPDAQVKLDDQPLRRVPFDGALFAGSRRLLIQRDGYQDLQRGIELVEGQTTALSLSLDPKPEPPPPPLLPVSAARGKRSTLRLLLGGAAIAGGAVLLGYGISGLVLNNHCEDLSIVDTSQCAQIYRTGTAGGVLLGLGIALSGTGVVLMALPPAKPRPASPAARGASAVSSDPAQR